MIVATVYDDAATERRFHMSWATLEGALLLYDVLEVVVAPFIQAVTAEFLTKRRISVEMSELKQEVLHLAQAQGSLAANVAEANRAVAVLVKVLTARRLFRTEDDTLVLADVLTDDESSLEDLRFLRHLDEFESRVTVMMREQASRQTGDTGAARQKPNPAPAPRKSNVDAALSQFFEGFDDELRQERLSFKPRKAGS